MQIVIAALGLAFLMFVQVIMRYMFDSPFSGIEEIAILLGVWIYFPAMGYATRTKEHIYGGVINLIVKDELKLAWIKFVTYLLCVISAVVFGYFALKYAINIYDKGRLSISLRWPRYLWTFSMAVGFILMLVYFVLDVFDSVKSIRSLKHKNSGHSPYTEQSVLLNKDAVK
ncbi:TRAP transporter small permease [Vibrio sp.]|uniref:TRAP transporter small permease n=1 Tax=Vibrio sp. TaxID=678 RepID=UPI003D10F954